MTEQPDYYEILGIGPDATRSEIEAAYDRLARRYQPDAEKAPEEPEKMRLLNEAFDELDDPIRRAAYHRERGLPEPPGETGPAPVSAGPADRKRTMISIGVLGAGLAALVAGVVLAIVAILDSDDEWVTLENGLRYRDIVEGTGPLPQEGQTVTVNYVGMLEDGTVFDSTEPGQPLTFVIGQGQVIEGWEWGIARMRMGSTRELIIPPELAYGEEGTERIPPNATLKFEVQLLVVQ